MSYRKWRKTVFVVCLAGGSVGASPLVTETPIRSEATATTLSVSAVAWTKAPAGTNTGCRTGIKISNPASNANVVYGILSVGAPAEATTIRPIEIQIGENPFIPVTSAVDLYLIAPDGAQNVHLQEVCQ